jgi:4-hydroxy-2-oxoheptanedioate aldolase
MTRANRLKSELKAGRTQFGTWSMLSSPSVINVIGNSGLDFVIIDLEHAPTSFETAEMQLYAAEAAGCTPIIRLGEGSDPTILHALDIGAQAVLVSQVATPEEALRISRASKYFPDGNRGLSPYTRNHGYSDVNLTEKLRKANEEMFVGVLVEGEAGIANLEKIARTPGLDMIYLGIFDISQAVGVPGDVRHPKVIKMVRDCVRVIEGQGLAAGSVAPDREYLKLLHEAGFRFLSYRVDSAVLREGFATARGWYDELAGPKKA